MKRGNTALKRGVAIAAAFTTAIAGAVLAAPAASAAAGAADSVRATPSADAAYVGSDGSAVKTYAGGATFAGGVPTGTAPLLAPNAQSQAANGLQIALKSGSTAQWSANATITVKLNAGVFTQGPSVSLGAKLVDLDSLDTNAGSDSGATAHAATVITGAANGAATLSSTTVTSSWGADHSELVLKLAAADPTTTASGNVGYLLTLSNVRVTTPKVSADFKGKVTATVSSDADGAGSGTGSFAAGVTTLGYVAPATLAAASGASVVGSAAEQNLPALTVTEGARDVFADAGEYVITGPSAVTFDATDAQVKFAGSDDSAKFTATVSAAANVLTVAIGKGTASGFDDTAVERFTVSGVTVEGVKGDSLDLAMTANDGGSPAADIIPVAAGNTTSSTFAFAPDLESVDLSITASAPSARVAGDDRYDTAAQLAASYVDAHGAVDTVIVANGESYKNGVDALAANYVAGQLEAPILLTTASSLPKATKDALTKMFKNSAASITVYIMGKTDSVSADVADAIKAAVEATVLPQPDVTVKRLAGDDRYETSALAAAVESGAIGQYAINNGDSLKRTAILASGLVNADALAAGSVSAGAHVPVLLTGSGDALPASVADAIKDLGITQVLVVGGTDRVSAKAVESLADLGVTSVKRIAGSDRYATAADLYTFADAPNTADDGGLGLAYGTDAYLANGTDGFADALAVGPLAGLGNSPILTTGATTLASAAEKFLGAHSANAAKNPGTLEGVTALGATDRVSADVLKAAQDALK